MHTIQTVAYLTDHKSSDYMCDLSSLSIVYGRTFNKVCYFNASAIAQKKDL